MALLRTFRLSHAILSLRHPLHCILACTKSLKICFICSCSFALTCQYQHMSAKQGCPWCCCSHAEWGLLIKAAVCVEIHSLLFSSYCCLAPMKSWWTTPTNPRAGILHPNRWLQLQAAKRPRFFSSWRVGVDSTSRHNSKWLSVPSFLSKGDVSVLIYLWDRLPFTVENLPLILIALLLTLADLAFPKLLGAFNYSFLSRCRQISRIKD